MTMCVSSRHGPQAMQSTTWQDASDVCEQQLLQDSPISRSSRLGPEQESDPVHNSPWLCQHLPMSSS